MEINPQNQIKGENQVFSFPDTLNNVTGSKSISDSPQYQPDNLQSTFALPEGGRVTVEILFSEAAENSQIDLQLRQPNQETLIEYANQNVGYTCVSPDYSENTIFELGIYWYWENEGILYQGIEAGAEVTSLGFGEYKIGFEAAGDDWDYNELVVKVKIETYLPIVFIDPPNISTGETATITVRKQYYDGRIEDFDSGQMFEFGMMEGCAAGVIISGSDTSDYFNGVPQPVTFLAADSLENEEESVRIGVGVVEQNPASKLQNRTKDLTDAKNLFREEKNTAIEDDENNIESIIIGTCFGGDFLSDKRDDEIVVVKQDEWCEELDECDEIEFPDIELEAYENNWQNLNVCQDPTFLAGTAFLTSNNSNYIEDFDIELCKEEGTDKIQFTFDDDIVINCVSDMCETNISAGQDILINDVYSFPNGTSCGDKIFWLELHKIYPMPTANIFIGPGVIIQSVYVIRAIWERHEEEHREHFLHVAEGFKAEYLTKVKETKEQCSKFNSDEEAITYFKKAAEKIIKQFYDAIKNEDDRISSGGDDGGDILKFEKDKIHKKVIDDYLQPLIDRWKLNNCVD